MSLGPGDLEKVVQMGVPVLLLDTCTALDVLRDITRKTVQLHNLQAAMRLLTAAELLPKPELVLVMAEQVTAELADNRDQVEAEARDALDKFHEQAQRVAAVATLFGAVGTVATAHLRDHVPRAKEVLRRWETVSLLARQGSDTKGRAMTRVVSAVPPSRRGKESAKDCLVVETYLETAAQLRAAQFKSKIVLGSSNTDDYVDPVSKRLHERLRADFAVSEIEFAPNFGAMRHLLGL